ncbi:MAG: CBS domain-containing protein [Candidatus Omnitrophica bacterium]|nr:CBS domain-containing protein [Candidatus Omnitrophota bacterium]
MHKKIAPKELIRQDFHNLKSSERLLTAPKIEDLIFMQSIEGRAHNGAGAFNKRFYVNTTIDDIVRALGRSPRQVKDKRQELIDEIVEFVDAALADDPHERLVAENGRPLLGIAQFKERSVNYHDVLKGLYLGGLRDDVDIRKKTQELYKIRIGYGRCYLIDTRVMADMGLDGEALAHQEHADEIAHYKSCGLIIEEAKPKHRNSKHFRYMYIRHHVGPGQSDDAAIVAAGLLYNIDVALGVFLADAIDTLEKYVNVYRDQDYELACYIKDNYEFLGLEEKDVYELAYVAAIGAERVDEIPDSSLRYLLAIDRETGQSTLETHLNYIEGKPFLPIAISYKRISILELYDFIKDKLKSIKKEAVVTIPELFIKELGSSVANVMHRRFITVSPQTSLKTALQKVEARKGEIIIVKDENGNILGVLNPNDFLVFLRERGRA